MASMLSIVTEGHEDRSHCGYCDSNDTSVSYGMFGQTLTVHAYEELIKYGWRRSGRWLYKPTATKTCCPTYSIRLDVTKFQHSKSQRCVGECVHIPECPIMDNHRHPPIHTHSKVLRKFEAMLSQDHTPNADLAQRTAHDAQELATMPADTAHQQVASALQDALVQCLADGEYGVLNSIYSIHSSTAFIPPSFQMHARKQPLIDSHPQKQPLITISTRCDPAWSLPPHTPPAPPHWSRSSKTRPHMHCNNILGTSNHLCSTKTTSRLYSDRRHIGMCTCWACGGDVAGRGWCAWGGAQDVGGSYQHACC